MAKYTKRNTTGSQVNNLSDNTKKYSLSPAEIIASKNRALGLNGKYSQERDEFTNGRLDSVTKGMFKKTLEQLEYINQATAKEFKKEKKSINSDIKNMNVGDKKEWDISYRDVNGNNVQSTIGVEKCGKKNKYYFIDNETGNKEYTSRNDFDQRLNTSIRNKVKDEHGIGSSLYTLTADDGTKFTITDARDDNAKHNSFKDGFKDINMYVEKPDGTKKQMTKKDVDEMVKQNGITNSDVQRGRTHKMDIGKAAKNVGKALKRGFEELENNMGNSTSTRA